MATNRIKNTLKQIMYLILHPLSYSTPGQVSAQFCSLRRVHFVLNLRFLCDYFE